MSLHPDGRDLVGVAQTHWDSPRQIQTSRVRAARIPCPPRK
jgi:hypothetical protein